MEAERSREIFFRKGLGRKRANIAVASDKAASVRPNALTSALWY
jgi:hypothetical protein